MCVAALITWKGSLWLEGSATKISKFYKLPAVVAGAIVMAVGSSFPEISTTVLSTLLHGEFDLGVATITGSAIFNILIIPSASVLWAGRVRVSRDLIYRDGQFYVLTLAVLLLTFSLAVIYYPVDGDDTLGKVTRPLAVIPLILYALYLMAQNQDTREYQQNAEGTEADIKKARDIPIGKQWLLFGAGLVLIVVGVEGLIRSVLFFRDYFDTSSFFWGATVLAAVTSMPDLLVSMRVAKKKEGETSMGNALGSNIFDLLVAIPLGVLVAGASVINFSQAVPMLCFLIIATVLYLVFMREKLELNKREAWVLLGVYGLFIAWLMVETLGGAAWLL